MDDLHVDDIGAPDVCLCGHGWGAHRAAGRCDCRRCTCTAWRRDYQAVDRHYRQMSAAS